MVTHNSGWKLKMAGLLVALLTMTAAPVMAKSPLITSMQVSESSGKLKILVSSTDQVQYKVINVKDPQNSLVVEVFPAQLAKEAKKALVVNKGVVKNVRIGQFSDNPDVVRLVVDLVSPAKYVIVMSPGGKGFAMSVVDSNFASAEAPKAVADLDKADVVNRPAASKTVARNSGKPTLVAYQPVPKKKIIPTPYVKKISLDFVNADLIYVLKILAKEMNMNLVTGSEVKGSVTMTLKDVPAEGALRVILKLAGFEYKIIDNTIFVGSPDTLGKIPSDIFGPGPGGVKKARPVEQITSLVIPLEFAKAADAQSSIASNYPELDVKQVPGQNMLMVKGYKSDVLGAKSLASSLDRPPPPPPPAPEMQVVRVNYGEAAQLLQIVKPMYPDLSFNLDTRLNAFITSGNPDSIQNLRDTLAKIDLPLQQVMLEVKVISLTEAATKALGFQSGTGGTNGTFTTTFNEAFENVPLGAPASVVAGQQPNAGNISFFIRSPFSITTTLQALITNNDATVIAQPRVVTQSGKEATLLIGDKFPIVFFDPRAGQFQVQYVDIGVKLQVKPVVTGDGYIVMDVKPDVSNFKALINNQFPQTATTQANINCRVRDGNTLVLGGLINESETTTLQKIPFLGDIPVLGHFFRSLAKAKQKAETMIMITPKTVSD